MGKATKQATASINKIRSKNKDEEMIKQQELRVKREINKILKSNKSSNPNIFIEADPNDIILKNKTILDFIKPDMRINTTADFFYSDNSDSDKGIEAQLILKTPSPQRAVHELIAAYEYGDLDKVILRGGFKLDNSQKFSLSCTTPFRGMLNLRLGILKTNTLVCPVLCGTWSESDDDGIRSGHCRFYLN